MTKKYSVLIKYKYLEYIESANIPDNEAWTFIKAIIEYDKSGTMPNFTNPVLTGLFAVVKLDLDQNRESYEEVSKSRSSSGKKGAKARWEKNSKNSNCQKTTENIANDSNCQKNAKTMAKMHDSGGDSGYDLGYESDLELSSKNININKGGGYIQPPPQILKQIKKESGAQGFFIDSKIAKIFYNCGIDTVWLSESFSFLEYCALSVKQKYPEKNNDELKPIFISAVKDWEDLRDSYPQWKLKQEKIVKKKEHELEIEKVKNNPPQICACGNKLKYVSTWDCMVCESSECMNKYEFDETQIKWVFIE